MSSGVLLAKNRNTSVIEVNSGLFYDDVSVTIPSETVNDLIPEGVEKVPPPGGNLKVEHGKEQITKTANGFQYKLNINPVVTAKSTTLTLDVSGVSLIGWNGDGTPRLSKSNFNTEVQIGNNGKDFVIGGIQKVNVVRSVAGLPFVKDIPGLGWLLSTDSESTKKSQLVLIARAEYAHPNDQINAKVTENVGKIVDDVNAGIASPTNNLGFQQLGIDTNKLQ
ncbi:hypothetical protein SDC9_176999 [bioreactor metagenome]|uniref:Type II/III secretion system secretin-like domain-containing protein n=1 Tax=bioreactor metagenome TaxID=1076179 RepID=A0A645GTK4_9ZZZZ